MIFIRSELLGWLVGVAVAVDWRALLAQYWPPFSHLVFAHDGHLCSVPVSCAECGRRQRAQLRLVGMRARNDRMGSAEAAGVGERCVAEAVWQCG